VETLQASVLEKQRLRREVTLYTVREEERRLAREKAAAEERARLEEEQKLRREAEEQRRQPAPAFDMQPADGIFR
jgi:hypothetical protein